MLPPPPSRQRLLKKCKPQEVPGPLFSQRGSVTYASFFLLLLTPVHSGSAGRGDMILKEAVEEWLPRSTPAKDP